MDISIQFNDVGIFIIDNIMYKLISKTNIPIELNQIIVNSIKKRYIRYNNEKQKYLNNMNRRNSTSPRGMRKPLDKILSEYDLIIVKNERICHSPRKYI
jgi:hypothetical protein